MLEESLGSADGLALGAGSSPPPGHPHMALKHQKELHRLLSVQIPPLLWLSETTKPPNFRECCWNRHVERACMV